MATEATTIATTTTATAAERGRTIRLLVDDSTERVVLAEAGEDVVVFLVSVLASLSAFDEGASAAASSIALVPALPLPRAAAAGKGRGIMAWRLFRCDHHWCRCSDVASRTHGSACPCTRPGCAAGRRDTELHFLEASFYRRPDGSDATGGRGAGRSGDTFYRCPARDGSRGRDFIQCRHRVTDERGVRCTLCHGLTSVEVKCAKAGSGSSCRYAILDDLTVRPIVVSADDAGLSVAALLSAVGVTADPAALRQVDVAFGSKEGLRIPTPF